MQSRLCTNTFRLSLGPSRTRLLSQRLIRRHYSNNNQDTSNRQGSEKQYPELDDILEGPARSFKQLIDQLETLIKHPNPPSSYADALAKNELRRMDNRDLTAEIKKEDMDSPRKHILRQRPRLLRDGRRIAEQSEDILEDSNDQMSGQKRSSNLEEIPPLSEQTAANLGITPEQQERRRIWMTKIKGYNAFRKNLISMDTLLGSIDTDRKLGSSTEPDLIDSLKVDKNFDLDLKTTQSLLEKEDAKFEELIRRSWKVYDEDVAGIETGASESKLDADTADSMDSPSAKSRSAPLSLNKDKGTPPGTRSYHTSRALAAADSSSRGPNTYANGALKIIKPANGPGGKREKRNRINFGREVKGILRQVVVPPKNIVLEHVLSDKENTEDVYIPIDASVNTGDVVEIRVESMQAIETPFTNTTHINGVVQKITGRFHFNVIASSGILAGARETRVGFVARGILFDEKFLRSCGAKPADVERILEYGKEIKEYIEEHGDVAVTSASEAEKLYRQQRLALQTAANVNSNMMKSSESSMAECEPSDDLMLLPAFSPAGLQDSGISDQTTDKAAGDGEHESITDVVLRVFPRVLRTFRMKADQLMRSRLFELDDYWRLATIHNKKYVTVDALAELIFGGKDKEPIGEVERLAVYIYLSKNTLHYIPDSDYLFVTNRFALRSITEVSEFTKTRDLTRSNSPEFQSFVHKAKRLIDYAYSKDPYSPVHSALDPDYESYLKSTQCEITGWSVRSEPIRRSPPKEPLLTEKEVEEMTFDQNDALFIKALCAYVFEAGPGYSYYDTAYGSIVPYIIKKMRFYPGCNTTIVTSFLIDIGIWPNNFNPMTNSRYIPLGSLGKDAKQLTRNSLRDSLFKDLLKESNSTGEDTAVPIQQRLSAIIKTVEKDLPAVKDSILTRKKDESTGSFSVMDKTEFYKRDICEDIRHDFGDLFVFTVDDADTRDIDDGFSFETVSTGSGETHRWVHVHVADPTYYVHPGHVASDVAFDKTSTLYLPGNVYSMFSKTATEKLLSLAPRLNGEPTPTMTFSFRIDEETGNIADYKVRPGLVRNIKAVPYTALNRYLSYDDQPEEVDSLAKVQVASRNSTLIHPFVPGDSDFDFLKEPKVELSEDQVKQVLGVQDIINKHYNYRIDNGTFTHLYGNRKIIVDSQVQIPGGLASKPRYLQKQYFDQNHGSLVYPRIFSYNTATCLDPAHAIVSELMIITGRIAARYACEHGSGTGSANELSANSSGVISEGKGVPILFRSQEQPNFDALSGVRVGLPKVFDELSWEQADSAKTVYEAVQRRARQNRGYIGTKYFDEIRHMLNPSRLSTTTGPHSIMGVLDEYGYSRVTSPLRRAEDLVGHWQIKAQLLAEHGNSKDKSPWYWDRYGLEMLSSKLYLRNFLAENVMANGEEYWIYNLIRRMESEARRGCLQLPPDGFYDANDPSYYDLPWAYYNPQKPGPLIWTAYVDNRDESRQFITTRIGILNSKAILPTRPIDPTLLPFAGARVRVQVVFIDPADRMMVVKIAPEEYQLPETPKFWRAEAAANTVSLSMQPKMMPPVKMPALSDSLG
ncbi:3'-5' RNA exonuclease complex component [Coemansia sp. RSA 485]|nr:3'-5' RNA exonuclease complex component [Coemansia sp. RSA 485]